MLYWIWLSLSVTAGSSTFRRFLSKGLAPEEIYRLDKEEIKSIIGTRSKDLIALSDKDTSRAEEILEFCTSKGVGIVTYSDEKYPEALRKIDNPPVLLYYRGKLPDFERNTFISVVGTRRISDYGRKNAFSVSRALALSGAVIVSGMAIGIDGVAHAAAISADMPTVAVIGSGIDVCYPRQHQTLARSIVKNGCVMTEYAPGTSPNRFNFPVRNRIVAALSSATVLIEGSEKSGALITARYAKSFGRTVYALPANVGSKNSEASNLLIKDGARLFTAAEDIIRDFETAPVPLNPFSKNESENVSMNDILAELSVSATAPSDDVFRTPRPKKSEDKSKLTEREDAHQASPVPVRDMSGFDRITASVYEKIPQDTDCQIDSLVEEGLTLREIMSALLRLEVANCVSMLPGDRVKRT